MTWFEQPKSVPTLANLWLDIFPEVLYLQLGAGELFLWLLEAWISEFCI